jgi:hypothetical protein
MQSEGYKLLEGVKLDEYDHRNDPRFGTEQGLGKTNPIGHSGAPKQVDFSKQLVEQKRQSVYK